VIAAMSKLSKKEKREFFGKDDEEKLFTDTVSKIINPRLLGVLPSYSPSMKTPISISPGKSEVIDSSPTSRHNHIEDIIQSPTSEKEEEKNDVVGDEEEFLDNTCKSTIIGIENEIEKDRQHFNRVAKIWMKSHTPSVT